MIRDNLKKIKLPANVVLVAASKTQTVGVIEEAFAAGVNHFGENRVEEAKEKLGQLPNDIHAKTTWHLIGHLQSRKVKEAVELFDWIDSVDSLELAKKINSAAQTQSKKMNVLVQVNISGEASKSGYMLVGWESDAYLYKKFASEIKQINSLTNINLCGLMTIAPQFASAEETRPIFQNVKLLQQRLQDNFLELNLPILSMGMSEDYQVAIEEGATMVRLGRIIFGERK